MKVLVINNDGAGFADYVTVDDEMTVRPLFDRQVASPKPQNYLIRVNRQPAPHDQILQEGIWSLSLL